MRRGRRTSDVPVIVTIAAVICCSPCICGIGIIALGAYLAKKAKDMKNWESPEAKKRRGENERRREIRMRTPKIMMPRLGRHLTIGREHPMEDDIEAAKGEMRPAPWTEQQAESPLFKLPFEIRKMIYEEVIGGYVFHIKYLEAYKKYCHTRCKRPFPKNHMAHCVWAKSHRGFVDPWGQSDLMAMLKSCRRIYSEAIGILYADNTFDFSELMGGLHDVLKFALLIPTERMQLIKSVKWLQVYSQGGSRIFGDRFGYEGTLARKVWEDETPWLVCRSPLTCSCIACMPEEVYKDTRSHEWLLYTWRMRVLDGNENLALQPVPQTGS